MKKNNLKVFFVATEQSGDNLGSELMKQFNSNIYYNFDFCGIGGDLMINEGLCITNHLSEFKSIGFGIYYLLFPSISFQPYIS